MKAVTQLIIGTVTRKEKKGTRCGKKVVKKKVWMIFKYISWGVKMEASSRRELTGRHPALASLGC